MLPAGAAADPERRRRSADYRAPRLSPDGERVAVGIWETTRSNLWIYDLARGTLSGLLSDGDDFWPVWSRDGQQIVFESILEGAATIHRRAADGISPASLVVTGNTPAPVSWSADGGLLAFVQFQDSPVRNSDIWGRRVFLGRCSSSTVPRWPWPLPRPDTTT